MSRTASLRRIATLYGVVEEMHSAALQQASATVQEAERALDAERIAAAQTVTAARTALSTGEREDWLLAHAEGELISIRRGLLEGMKAQRVAVESVARAEFLAVRIQAEQMKQVVTQMVDRTALEEGRRSQAVSDDRYAARRAWLSNRRVR